MRVGVNGSIVTWSVRNSTFESQKTQFGGARAEIEGRRQSSPSPCDSTILRHLFVLPPVMRLVILLGTSTITISELRQRTDAQRVSHRDLTTTSRGIPYLESMNMFDSSCIPLVLESVRQRGEVLHRVYLIPQTFLDLKLSLREIVVITWVSCQKIAKSTAAEWFSSHTISTSEC
ncbi:hypothetical protein B0H10DRAFT_1938163 [Mycena sp. CBHHK59/15]|nr:hypothetical protein B0H10DRAFT_1938163 [Mycena sp. CBHHK59/15]